MRMRINFDEVRSKKKVRVRCTVCGKPHNRVLTSYQTLNPFNKNKDGLPKTRAEIYPELEFDIENQEKKLHKEFICSKCGDK